MTADIESAGLDKDWGRRPPKMTQEEREIMALEEGLADLSPDELKRRTPELCEKLRTTPGLLDADYAEKRKANGRAGECPPSPLANKEVWPYSFRDGRILAQKTDRDGKLVDPHELTNFTARIMSDVVEDDGVETRRVFEIAAQIGRGPIATFEVPADRFISMTWPMEKLGASAYIAPGNGSKDQARAAIQKLSPEISTRTAYTHTGWRKIGGSWAYLHGGGAIGSSGALKDMRAQLPATLTDYELPDPPALPTLREALRASLAALDVAPDNITVPLFGAVWRAALGGADFSVHCSGGSGNRKSELAALAQQHWGPKWSGRHLPGSWSSSANALEAMAFHAKDAVFVVDDFVPLGASAADVARAHREADRLLRAQGNQAGRQRMRADTSLRPEKPPRGLILSTGEDVPRGQSLGARMVVLEVGPTDVRLDKLTLAQKNGRDGRYAETMAGYLKWLADDFECRRDSFKARALELRSDAQAKSRHGRTGDAIASLAATWETFLRFAISAGLSKTEAHQLKLRAWKALEEVAQLQDEQQVVADPIERYRGHLQSALGAGHAHIAGATGSYPSNPAACGWRRDGTMDGIWRPQGDRIGWLLEGELYLEPGAAYAAAQRQGSALNEPLGVSEVTLRKRLEQKGHLLTTENTGGKKRMSVRQILEGRRRSVLHVSRSFLSIPNDGVPSAPDVETHHSDQELELAHLAL